MWQSIGHEHWLHREGAYGLMGFLHLVEVARRGPLQIANGAYTTRDPHEDAPFLHLVRRVGKGDQDQRGRGVGWNSQKLRNGVGWIQSETSVRLMKHDD